MNDKDFEDFEKLTYVFIHKDDVQVCKKNHDNTVKDNVTVTLSNLSQNDGTIRILTHFLAKNHSKLPIADINLTL